MLRRLLRRLAATAATLLLLGLVLSFLFPAHPLTVQARAQTVDGLRAAGGLVRAGWEAAFDSGRDLVTRAPREEWLPVVDGLLETSGGVVRVTGHGTRPASARSPAQARLMARGAAELDAERQLAGMLAGARVRSSRSLDQHTQTGYTADERIGALLRGAQIVGERVDEDGNVQVDMELCVALPPEPAFTEVSLSDFDHEEAIVEPLSPVAPEPAEPIASAWSGPPSGVIVDARGVDFTPALFPEVVNEAGQPVVDPDALSLDALDLSRPPITFVESVAEARALPGMGAHPMLITAVDTPAAGGSTLVVAQRDVDRLLAAGPVEEFLSEGRVAVVVSVVK